MATPRKVQLYPIAKTPVKNAFPKACIACAKQSSSHLRLIWKNAALQSVYMDLLKILETDMSKLEVIKEKLYICDTCIHLTAQIKSLRKTCQANVNKLLNTEENRFKRMVIHSASPNERKKNCSYEKKDINISRDKTKKSKISLTFPKKVLSTDQMVGTLQCENQEADSEVSTLNTKSSDHVYAASTYQPETSPDEDHLNYCRRDTAAIYRDHSILKSYATDSSPSPEIETLSKLSTMSALDSQKLASKIMQLPHLATAIRNVFLHEITFKLDRLCGTGEKSVLRSSFHELSDKTYFNKIITEMEQRCPLVLDILIAMCYPAHHSMKGTNYTVAAIYGMVMHSRNPQLTAFQKMVAVSCIRHHAGNGLLNLLSSMNISTPLSSKYSMLEEVGKLNGKDVVSAVSVGRSLKVTVDNIDGRIIANQVRAGSGNRDFHYTHWTILVDRATEEDLSDLSGTLKFVPMEGPDASVFFLNDEEHQQLRNAYKWMVCKILVEEIPSLNVFKKAVPDVLEHRFRHIVDRPSEVNPMFVIMKDPKPLPNCVMIMDKMLETLKSIYTNAGREDDFEDVRITLGGDQLTRVCFDSAKNLRAGTHTATERLEQLSPVIEELFHVEQDLLEKIIKIFYKTESSREDGTLTHFRTLLGRRNVTGQVKATNGFEAHKDFVVTVTRALIVELACEKLGLVNKLDGISLPENLKSWRKVKERQWLENLVEPVVDEIFTAFKKPSMNVVNMRIETPTGAFDIVAPAHLRGKHIDMLLNGQKVRIPVPGEQPPPVVDDDVYNYSLSFLRVAMDFLQLDDLVKAGDIDRLTIVMKRLCPTFIGLTSYRSKYAIECVNFLTKTECLLSEKDSVKVKLEAFVNPSGKAGENKAADMQQENNIKMVKTVLRGLGAGKTDKALERSSKAAPVITSIEENFKKMTGSKSIANRHVKKSMEGDVNLLCEHLRIVRPFKAREGRTLDTYLGIKSSVFHDLDKYKLREFMSRHSRRGMSRVYIEDQDGI